MDIHKYGLVLLPLLLAAVQASYDSPKSTSMVEGDQKPVTSSEDVSVMELVGIGENGLSMQCSANYPGVDFFSKVDDAIEREDYAFLKSLYPSNTMIWLDDHIALLLAKAFGRTGWMSEEEWEECSKSVDWELRFQSLIRSRNENIYANEDFRNFIFRNKIFRGCRFIQIIKEAYDVGNFAFLSTIPYPDEEFPLDNEKALFFWSLAYKQKWGSERWDRYIDGTKPISEWWIQNQIIWGDNPKTFEHGQIKESLRRRGVSESLEMAIMLGSLSFALYLKEKFGQEEFQTMSKMCLEIRAPGVTLADYSYIRHSDYYMRLSRVYNLLLENGRNIKHNVKSIEFCDVPTLDEKYLQPLLDNGFSKKPSDVSDIISIGRTRTGIEFLKKILRGEYGIDEELLESIWEKPLGIKLVILDIEAFKLIEDRFVHIPKEQRHSFYTDCARRAIYKRDIRFLIDTTLLFNDTYLDPEDVIGAALNGDLIALDWILKARPECLERIKDDCCCSMLLDNPSYIPILRHLSKHVPTSEFLARRIQENLKTATENNDEDHYNQVIAIKHAIDEMKAHKRQTISSDGDR